MKSKLLLAIAFIALGISFNACKEDDKGLTGVNIYPIKLRMGLDVEAELTAKLQAFPVPADIQGETFTWSSADPSIADVAADGTVTAKAEGSTTITAKNASGSVTNSIPVVVVGTSVPVDSFKIAVDTIKNFYEKMEFTLEATVYPSNATGDLDPTLASDKPDVIKVDGQKIIGVSAGTAVITMTLRGMTQTIDLVVKAGVGWDSAYISPASRPASVNDIITKDTIMAGTFFTFNAIHYPAAVLDGTLVFKTSDKAVASIGSDGQLLGVKAGKVAVWVEDKNGAVKSLADTIVVLDFMETMTTLKCTGLWSFQDLNNLGTATIGNALTFKATSVDAEGKATDADIKKWRNILVDGPYAGKNAITTVQNPSNVEAYYALCQHGVAAGNIYPIPTGWDATVLGNVNIERAGIWTFMCDVNVPTASACSFFETSYSKITDPASDVWTDAVSPLPTGPLGDYDNVAGASNGGLRITADGKIGSDQLGYSDAGSFPFGQWVRLIVTRNAFGGVQYYVNGKQVYSRTFAVGEYSGNALASQTKYYQTSLDPKGVFLWGDGGTDNAQMYVSSIAWFDNYLTAAQAASLCGF